MQLKIHDRTWLDAVGTLDAHRAEVTSVVVHSKDGNVLTLQLAKAIAALPQLTSLEIDGAGMTEESLEALFANPGTTTLTTLCLLECDWAAQLEQRIAVAIAKAKFAARLTTLELAQIRLGDAGAHALAALLEHGTLKRLRVVHAALEDAGIAVLAASAPLRELDALFLSQNGIGNAGAAALTHALRPGRPAALHVSDSGLDDDALQALRSAVGESAWRDASAWWAP
ncbi:MAG: hypothetical protein R3B13_00830 [Polyangiaceae bacterium]